MQQQARSGAEPPKPLPGRPCITVSGTCSGVGKTSVVERLLRLLDGASALKVTVVDSGLEACPIDRPCRVCAALARPFDVLTARRVLDVPGKDTGRYLAAGARRVVWVKTHGEALGEALAAGLEAIGEGPLVVEGNTPVPRLAADLSLMVDRAGARRETKPSARQILERMDAGVLNTVPPVPPAPARRRLAGELPGRPLLEVDVRAATDQAWRTMLAPLFSARGLDLFSPRSARAC